MRAKLGSVALLCCSLLGVAGMTACGGSAGEQDAGGEVREAAASSEWMWLQKSRRELDGKRQELARARQRAARPGAADPAVLALAQDVRTRTEEYRRRLLQFINDNPPPAGEPASGLTLEAIRLKSDEDILVAREHIDEGGDYRTAIDIYEAALAVDPENERLEQELAKAQARRYMTRQRFEQAQEGMTADQVRALLGPPNVNDIRDYPARGVTGWFYARDAQGGAAAVWFEKQRDGRLEVYELDFDALPAP